MKRIILVAAVSAVMVVGCARNRTKATAAPAPAPTPELTPPPTPTYTPAPEPAVTPTPVTSGTQTKPAPTAKPAPAAKSAVAEPKSQPAKPVATSKGYVVKKGDTLSEIAAANHTTVQKIMALNPEIKKADAIYVGQKLKMP